MQKEPARAVVRIGENTEENVAVGSDHRRSGAGVRNNGGIVIARVEKERPGFGGQGGRVQAQQVAVESVGALHRDVQSAAVVAQGGRTVVRIAVDEVVGGGRSG